VQVPSGLKHILQTGSRRLTYNHKIKKQSTLPIGKTIESCVLQGSILGTLLFIIYINDLPYGINPYAKPVIYADDMSVLITANSFNDLQPN
jgi:hypothetical protein